MASISANGIDIEYETAGNPLDPPLLLIMGLGAQLIAWDDEFVEELVSRGFYVIRFDNRDVGLSTWFDDAGVPDVAAIMVSGGVPEPAYLLADMADDAAGLLDALGILRAHVVGASMGGMIAQSLAIRHPDKVLTLVSIMSTTGAREVGQPHEEALAVLMQAPAVTRDGVIEGSVRASSVIGSTGFGDQTERVRVRAAEAFDRAVHPEGMARQLLAIVASPDRTPALASVKTPTLVIHGEIDPLVDPSGGRATAAAIPGAELWIIPGMGHDLPAQLFGPIADRLAVHCKAV
jgi:pimeloyl-ACP methyl ester carboxylesterase